MDFFDEIKSLLPEERREKFADGINKFMKENSIMMPIEESDCIRVMLEYTNHLKEVTRKLDAETKACNAAVEAHESLMYSREYIYLCEGYCEDMAGNAWGIFESNGRYLENIIKCHDHGVVYILEVVDGVKIGMTSSIRNRMSQHRHSARSLGVPIGKIAVSLPHKMYANNEKIIHKSLSKYRADRSEYFRISMNDALSLIPQLDTEIMTRREIYDRLQKQERTSELFMNIAKGDRPGMELIA